MSRHKYVGITEHVAICQTVLGKKLPAGCRVHHVDNNPRNNEKTNLVVCPSEVYHRLIHQRTDAINACGNPAWRKCTICKKYDAIENMRIKSGTMGTYIHRACHSTQCCESASRRRKKLATLQRQVP